MLNKNTSGESEQNEKKNTQVWITDSALNK